MNRHARLNALLDLMAAQGHIDVDAVARTMRVSASTIRRDLNHLNAQQLVTRTRGGAVATSVSYDLPIRYRRAAHHAEKVRIAKAAAALIGPGAIVGLNGGTTTTEVARAIAKRSTMDPGGAAGPTGPAGPASAATPVTIVTNAINIANELTVRRNVKLVMTGGVARPKSFELTGSFAAATLGQVNLDYAVMAVDAFDADVGAKAADEEEAAINQRMAAQADKLIIVADSSKLNARAFARICPVSALTYFITDSAAPAPILNRVRAQGVTVFAV